MRRVLDASALLSGASFDGELYTTPEAVREVRRHGSTPQLDAVLATKVRILTPAAGSLDDYSIQNVATRLGVPYERVLERGIVEVVRWRYRCTGCGRFFDEPIKECPVCGSRVKTTRARPR